MSALICGSLAYDTVMVFPGRFKEHILADRIHMLNVSFLAQKLTRYYGGCAGNIAYNLALLGGKGHAMGAVGHDFAPYSQWMRDRGMSERHVRVIETEYTAQAYITTDLDANQITAFHPGAMEHSHKLAVPTDGSITIGILAPDGRDGMLTHAQQFAAAGIPYIFDPGQAMPLFNGEEFRAFVERAGWVAVNDYEMQLLMERTGWTAEQIAAKVRALIVTRGGEGSVIHTAAGRYDIPPVRAAAIKDPTGCGDAYRAALLHGLMQGLEWPVIGRMASLIGSIKIEHVGTQHHSFTPGEFGARYHREFGHALTWKTA